MNKSDFLLELQEMLQVDDPLHENTDLLALDEWDSLAFMVINAFFDKNFGQRLTFEEIGQCATPGDLIALAQGRIS